MARAVDDESAADGLARSSAELERHAGAGGGGRDGTRGIQSSGNSRQRRGIDRADRNRSGGTSVGLVDAGRNWKSRNRAGARIADAGRVFARFGREYPVLGS